MKKNIKIFLLLVIIIGVVFLMFFMLKGQNDFTKNMGFGISKEECIKNINEIDDPQKLVESIEGYGIKTENLTYIYELLIKHFSCILKEEQDENKKEQIFQLANAFTLKNIFNNISRVYIYDYLAHAQDENFEYFFTTIISKDWKSLSRDKFVGLCEKDNSEDYFIQDGSCNGLYDKFIEYEKDKNVFQNDISNANIEDSYSNATIKDVFWMILSSIFRGEKETLDMCNNFSRESNFLVCERLAYRYEIRLNMGCDKDKIWSEISKTVCGE